MQAVQVVATSKFTVPVLYVPRGHSTTSFVPDLKKPAGMSVTGQQKQSLVITVPHLL